MYKKILILLTIICFPFQAIAKTNTAHVLVALCDNFHQRIYPVPYKLGKGDDPDNNLYWGALYGVRTHFRKSKEWILVEEIKNPNPYILRRAIFKHKDFDNWMVADAYLGKKIKKATQDLFDFSAGGSPEKISIKYNDKDFSLNIGGSADLIAYVGHNGLMDFELKDYPNAKNDEKRETVVLACYSKSYFKDAIAKSGATPLVLTNGKMAPEGYVLQAILDGWVKKESSDKLKERAGEAYAKYQKISKKAGIGLFK